jgi:predicted amidohydrolase YtcJ
MRGKEQLYFGGEVYTLDDRLPAAEAVAVRDGYIIAVGSRSACESALSGTFEATDLRGRSLLPGFIDTHLHPLMLVYFDMNADLHGVSSMSDLGERMRASARGIAPGAWVVGLQFDEQDMDDPRLPTRHDLDAACPDNPVMIVKHDGHTVFANSLAIREAGVTAATPDPEGGVIDREPDGYPAGTFRESASLIIKSKVPIPDLRLFVDGARSSFGRLAACGVTSAGAVMQTDTEGPAGDEGAFEIPLMQALLEYVPINLYGILIASDIEQVTDAQATPLHDPVIGAGHRVGAVKIYADGTYGSCTAYMDEPFTDQPDKRGFLAHDAEELYRRMLFAHQAGLQVCIHAIGDAANRTCLELYRRLLTEHPRVDHRHRLEHASQLDAGIVEDMARLGIVVSTQPMFIHSEKGWLHKRLGEERAKWTYPFRSLVEGGVRVAGASDGPIESVDVLHAIYCCVTREGFEPGQAIAAEQALRMYTVNAACAQFEDSVKGSITRGKRADLVVLSDNPVSVEPEAIRDITVDMTIVGGEVAYERAE